MQFANFSSFLFHENPRDAVFEAFAFECTEAFAFIERDGFRHVATGVEPCAAMRQHGLNFAQQDASVAILLEFRQDHQAANVKRAVFNATADGADDFSIIGKHLESRVLRKFLASMFHSFS